MVSWVHRHIERQLLKERALNVPTLDELPYFRDDRVDTNRFRMKIQHGDALLVTRRHDRASRSMTDSRALRFKGEAGHGAHCELDWVKP